MRAHNGDGEHPVGSEPDCPGCEDWTSGDRDSDDAAMLSALFVSLAVLAVLLMWLTPFP